MSFFAQNAVRFIADERAIKEVLCNKGASGNKFCHVCCNVVSGVSTLADVSSYLRPGTCTDTSQWKLHTDSSTRKLLTRLRGASGAGLPAVPFAALQMRLGYNHAPPNVPMEPKLKFGGRRAVIFDWMHVVCVHGLFQTDVGQLMHLLQGFGINDSDLHTYFGLWRWPKQIDSKSSPGRLREPRRASRYSELFKAEASEALSVFTTVASFSRNVVLSTRDLPATHTSAANSFLHLYTTLELLQDISTTTVSPPELASVTEQHSNEFLNAYQGE